MVLVRSWGHGRPKISIYISLSKKKKKQTQPEMKIHSFAVVRNSLGSKISFSNSNAKVSVACWVNLIGFSFCNNYCSAGSEKREMENPTCFFYPLEKKLLVCVRASGSEREEREERERKPDRKSSRLRSKIIFAHNKARPSGSFFSLSPSPSCSERVNCTCRSLQPFSL